MEYRPKRFIEEQIEVQYDQAPLLEKIPGPPDGFTWREQHYRVSVVLKEWHDYRRRGRMARNMQPQHAEVASHRGSWGVGLDYYRVKTDTGQIFDIYYDRAPKDADRRKGQWFLNQELAE
ncbi:MAG: DUF6504 family protein [Omnitrophica WOR_2 bacterium]